MSTNVNNYIRLTLPSKVAGTQDMQAAIKAATNKAGGCTAYRGEGAWVNKSSDEMIVEQVEVYQWNFGPSKLEDMRKLTRDIVDCAFAHGEEAVFRERCFFNTTHRISEYRGCIIHAPTKH